MLPAKDEEGRNRKLNQKGCRERRVVKKKELILGEMQSLRFTIRV